MAGNRSLNPAAREFFPQNQATIFPIISTHHHYNLYSSPYFRTFSSSPSQPVFLPPPPPPPLQPFLTSAPVVGAQDHHHHHHHHHYDGDQTAVVVVSGRRHDHHDDQQHQNRAGNERRPRFVRRRGSGFLGRKRFSTDGERRRRLVLRGNLSERNCDSRGGVNVVQVQVQHSSSSEVLPLMHGDTETTVMIRNIPSKYTCQMLLDFLDDHCMLQNQINKNAAGEDDQQPIISAFDFLYLPMDFRTELNKGYAFVNFTSPEAASKFSEATNNQKWDYFHSSKIRKIARARLQGKNELIRHFESMGFPCGKEEFLPVWFLPPRDGTNKESVTQTTVGKLVGKRREWKAY